MTAEYMRSVDEKQSEKAKQASAFARLALAFLQRVDLKGAEVPQYNAVQQWLQDMVNTNDG